MGTAQAVRELLRELLSGSKRPQLWEEHVVRLQDAWETVEAVPEADATVRTDLRLSRTIPSTEYACPVPTDFAVYTTLTDTAVDAQMLQDTARFKMDLVAGLERTLHGQVKPSKSPCHMQIPLN